MAESGDRRSSAAQPPPASIPIWLLLFMAAVFMLACGGLWGYILITRPAAVTQPTPTPIFIVITPARLPTSRPMPTAPTVDAPVATPAPTFPPPPAGSLIQIDAYVRVVNTGEGLRLRYEPGLENEVNYLALDYEVFRVEEGPRDGDGIIWWFLVSQSDSTRNGWGAANYLQVIR